MVWEGVLECLGRCDSHLVRLVNALDSGGCHLDPFSPLDVLIVQAC